MPAEEAAQIRQLLGRQEDELEFRQCIALRQLEEALQVLGAVGMEARRRERRGQGDGVACGEGETQQAFALDQEPVQIIGELGGIDDAEQLDIARLEHDAVVGGAPADVATARRQGESEVLEARPRCFQIPDSDEAMIDAGEPGKGLAGIGPPQCTAAQILRLTP